MSKLHPNSLPGIQELMLNEGFDYERWRAYDTQEKYNYFIEDFIGKSKNSVDLMMMFMKGGQSIFNFTALLWAKHNEKHPMAREIDKKIRKLEGQVKHTKG